MVVVQWLEHPEGGILVGWSFYPRRGVLETVCWAAIDFRWVLDFEGPCLLWYAFNFLLDFLVVILIIICGFVSLSLFVLLNSLLCWILLGLILMGDELVIILRPDLGFLLDLCLYTLKNNILQLHQTLVDWTYPPTIFGILKEFYVCLIFNVSFGLPLSEACTRWAIIST